MFWRLPDEWRRTRQHWTHLLKPGFEPKGLAEQLIKRAFGTFIPLLAADNDRDDKRW